MPHVYLFSLGQKEMGHIWYFRDQRYSEIMKYTHNKRDTVGNYIKEYVLLDTKRNTAKLKLRIHLLYY